MELQELIGFFLPPGTLDYFTIKTIEVEEGEKYMGLYGFDDHYTVVLEEKKSLPNHPTNKNGKHLRTKGYSDKLIEDFPIRGRKTTLLFRRRKWEIEGEAGILMREIDISSEGVKYSKEFSFFFEERN